MPDDIDRMLQEEGTPPGSQPQNMGQQDDSIQRIEQQTEEEVEFSKLSGSAQERFKDVLSRARAAEERAALLESQRPAYIPPAPNSITPDQEQAVQTLSKFGIATDDKVKSTVSEEVNRLRWDLRQQQLSTKYSGQDGTPQYSRDDVEDFIRTHPQYSAYDPEDVFKFKMYPDEFAAAGQTQTPARKTSSLRPTKSQQQQNSSGDINWLMDRIDPSKHTDADEYYEAHRDEVERAIKSHTDQYKGTNFGGQ